MTRLQDLYRTADRLGLQVCCFPLHNSPAISSPDGCIGLDKEKLPTSAEELACLAHEMGHCVTGGFYTMESSMIQRARCEQRAERWAIRRLVPLPELKRVLKRGITRPDELAEHFCVTEEFLRKSLRYYKEARNAL